MKLLLLLTLLAVSVGGCEEKQCDTPASLKDTIAIGDGWVLILNDSLSDSEKRKIVSDNIEIVFGDSITWYPLIDYSDSLKHDGIIIEDNNGVIIQNNNK